MKSLVIIWALAIGSALALLAIENNHINQRVEQDKAEQRQPTKPIPINTQGYRKGLTIHDLQPAENVMNLTKGKGIPLQK